ncbi:hypothetical protein [uncultured Dermacoccus sp.]|uniref:hypothetical protein n=1 Tax=uncultured Dermacoccus sp. TaxID=339343 RepID=UPI002596780F|nr:hypothetical protein [uncultured Dermacoccus sp.]
MSINLMLPSRATIKRSEADYSSGSPEYVWTTIAVDVPVLFSRATWQEQHADTAATQARSNGTMYFEPDADVKPGDNVVIAGVGSFTIGSDGGVMADYLGNSHHIEYNASQVK